MVRRVSLILQRQLEAAMWEISAVTQHLPECALDPGKEALTTLRQDGFTIDSTTHQEPHPP